MQVTPSAADCRRVLEVEFLGRFGYPEAVALQEERRRRILGGEAGEALVLLEHPHVYTLGRNAERADVLAPDAWLDERGVAVFEASRGGQVTYHGPGQLVGYPVVNLDPDRRDLRRYVRDLQEVLLRTLKDYGVEGEGRAQPEIGVWAGGCKVASIGVHVRHWVTIHGFALNVSTDLSYFQGIVACGLQQVSMGSIESLTGARPSLAEVAATAARHFGDVFERRLEQTQRNQTAVERTQGVI